MYKTSKILMASAVAASAAEPLPPAGASEPGFIADQGLHLMNLEKALSGLFGSLTTPEAQEGFRHVVGMVGDQFAKLEALPDRKAFDSMRGDIGEIHSRIDGQADKLKKVDANGGKIEQIEWRIENRLAKNINSNKNEIEQLFKQNGNQAKRLNEQEKLIDSNKKDLSQLTGRVQKIKGFDSAEAKKYFDRINARLNNVEKKANQNEGGLKATNRALDKQKEQHVDFKNHINKRTNRQADRLEALEAQAKKQNPR